ncbi:hypothetical protein [Ruegeria profundi]|uniref:hypothetical protein n=1 Tax=Ruegeria profundi TaxID=1685378 RepID=UPI003C7D7231
MILTGIFCAVAFARFSLFAAFAPVFSSLTGIPLATSVTPSVPFAVAFVVFCVSRIRRKGKSRNGSGRQHQCRNGQKRCQVVAKFRFGHLSPPASIHLVYTTNLKNAGNIASIVSSEAISRAKSKTLSRFWQR